MNFKGRFMQIGSSLYFGGSKVNIYQCYFKIIGGGIRTFVTMLVLLLK